MSRGVSSLLFTFAFQTTERQRKQCNLSKRKRHRSIGFSLQLCFHTAAEAGCGALMNDTLTFPSPLPPVSVLGSRGLSLRWCGSAGTSLCAGTWFSSVQRPQSTAVRFVIVDFRQCRWLCRGGNTRRPDLSESWLYWIIPHSLVPLREVELSCLPVALKNTWLQCSWSRKGSSCPPYSVTIHIYYSLCKLKVYLCMPKSMWTILSTFFMYFLSDFLSLG